MARAKKTDTAEGMVEVRVIFGCDLGVVNDVIELQADKVQSFESAGLVDSSASAVEYAKSLKA